MKELDVVELAEAFTLADGPLLHAGTTGTVLEVLDEFALVEFVDQRFRTLGVGYVPGDKLRTRPERTGTATRLQTRS